MEKQKQVEKTNKKVRFSLKKEKKALQNGGYSVILTIIVIAVVIMLNMIVKEIPSKYTQFDISTGKLYTIGQETMDVLNALDQDINIYYIVQKGNEDSNIEKLLNLYAENSKHVNVEKKDPIVYPSFVKQYTEEEVTDNSLIVECGSRNKIISYNNIYEMSMDYGSYQQSVSGFDGEGQITSAISYVLSDSLTKMYYVEGHNEVAIPTAVKERVEKANIQLESLSLLTLDAVPEDAAAVMLNAPAADYSQEETQKLIDYLNQGGRAIILADYIENDMPNFNSILTQYGVEVVNGIILESDQKHYVQTPYLLVPNIEYSDVTQNMTNGSQYVLVSGCQGFRIQDEETINVKSFLLTSDKAIVKKDPNKMKTYEKEDGDEDGPFSVGVSVSKNVGNNASNNEGNDTKEMRLVAFSSSTILEDSLNKTVADGNYTLYMNAVNWLVDMTETQVTSIPSKSMAMTSLTVTAAKGVIVSVLVCFVLPFLCLIIGGIVCIRRKRK